MSENNILVQILSQLNIINNKLTLLENKISKMKQNIEFLKKEFDNIPKKQYIKYNHIECDSDEYTILDLKKDIIREVRNNSC